MTALAVHQHQGLVRTESAQGRRNEQCAIAHRQARVVERGRQLGQGGAKIDLPGTFEIGALEQVDSHRQFFDPALDTGAAADDDHFFNHARAGLCNRLLTLPLDRRSQAQGCEHAGQPHQAVRKSHPHHGFHGRTFPQLLQLFNIQRRDP